ncbi:Unannotated [Lentimonas sp. CC4]|nr:Unannotated [Lentimonas sp. CC4]
MEDIRSIVFFICVCVIVRVVESSMSFGEYYQILLLGNINDCVKNMRIFIIYAYYAF